MHGRSGVMPGLCDSPHLSHTHTHTHTCTHEDHYPGPGMEHPSCINGLLVLWWTPA